jgi:ABC-type nitrate/sulfonate/bicarbonate transport system permease component
LLVLMGISLMLLGVLSLIERRVLRWQTANAILNVEATT